MTHRQRILLVSTSTLAVLAASLLVFGRVPPTSHPTTPSPLGTPSSSSALEAVIDEPGPVRVETVVGADWQVPRSGLINLDNPKASAAGLEDGPEPIIIAFHAIEHPTRGLYLVDTGVERAFRTDPSHALIHGIAGRVMGADQIRVRVDTKTWLERHGGKVRGVLMTHLHADHVAGMRDLPAGTPVYAGPGETASRSLTNLAVRPITDAALAGKPLYAWRFGPDPDGRFDGVLDVFGDGSVWALHVPGHTPGSTAYLARTPRGPVLLTGDACHTAWGWKHRVEPGSFSEDVAQSARSLASLEELVARHPEVDVRPGHQLLHPSQAAPSRALTSTR